MVVLAKKGHPANPNGMVDLWTHTKDVWDSSFALFGRDEPTRLATAWFRFFKFPLSRWQEFRHLLSLACLWHDIGKATCSFQEMLHDRVEQVVRHEYLSAALLLEGFKRSGELRKSLYPLIYAVIGHHLKSGYRYYSELPDPKDLVVVYADDSSVRKILSETRLLLGDNVELALPASVSGPQVTNSDFWNQVFTKLAVEQVKGDPDILRCLSLALIVSDAAGSALRRKGIAIEEWIGKCFNGAPLNSTELRDTIITGREQAIVRRTNEAFEPNAMQTRVSSLPSRAVVLSPCGSGKTLAAYLWAERQLKAHKVSRLIFLYPTRNTATEGFRDYTSWGNEEAGLMHGTSDFDLDGMTFNGDGRGENKEDMRHQASFKTEEALYALGYWNKRYISATVDSFLSFTANRYAADCVLPLLCDSLLVVDEVHALDPRMFRHLTAFLAQCDLPALLMTATLPPRRRLEFEKLGIAIDDGDGEALDSATRARYAVEVKEDASMDEDIRAWLSGTQKRLLIVRNQVSTCQATAREVQALIRELSPETELLVYHSRFKLEDRRSRHEEVIEKFQAGEGRYVLVSTQVCQMSLDLDAETLFSELAPLPDLIQRMGRANRRGLQDTARVVIFSNEKKKPYEAEELDEARDLLSRLPSPLSTSQLHLATLMDAGGSGDAVGQHAVPLFELLPELFSQPYRDIQEFTVDCILDRDVPRGLEVIEQGKRSLLAGLIVPVPKREASPLSNSKFPRYLQQAEASKYCSTFGYGGQDE